MTIRLSALKQVANTARADLENFKNQALAAGITKAVDIQLETWGLSAAERDVAYFLIKGLSFKEISVARKTSEHTVRQQAATIYKKSALDGRAQLSAFFLEDLFTPHGTSRVKDAL
jgi:DNA-binding CsgD family transcriptional regulator